MTTIRYEALTSPIDPIRLAEFSKRADVARSDVRYYKIIGIVLALVFSLFFVPVIMITIGGTLGHIGIVAPLLVILSLAACGTAGYFIGDIVARQALKRMYRLMTFAESNGWSYNQKLANPAHSGMIFGHGHSRYVQDQVYSTSGNLFEIGNYFYTTGSGKNQQTHTWGYLCIKLMRHVPNMVLDSKSNNMKLFGLNVSNLPESLRGNATLSLEGDFNNHFTLYAPKEYERDALYIFTPELMALLVDESSKFDVEVVDDRMYVYSSSAFDMTQMLTMQKLFAIISQVGEEMIDNTDYYADERVGNRQADVIAQPGRRLKQSVPLVTIVIVVVFMAYFALSFFS